MKIIQVQYIFLALATLTSCQLYQDYTSQKIHMIENTPLLPFKRSEFTLYFDDVSQPNKPFLEGKRVTVALRDQNITTFHLSNALKNKAFQLGYDGVIYLEKDKYWEESYSLGLLALDAATGFQNGPTTVTNYYQSLSGIGIKFIDNINYLDQFLHFEEAFKVISGTKMLLYRKYFDFNGEVTHIDFESKDYELFHDQLLGKYDINRLMNEKRNWKYRLNDLGKVHSRKLVRMDDWVLENVKYKYKKGVLSQLKYGVPPAGMREPLTYDVFKLKLDDLGHVSQFSLFLNEQLYLTEQHLYEGNNKMKRLVQLANEGTLYEINYVYYQNSTIDDLSNSRKDIQIGVK